MCRRYVPKGTPVVLYRSGYDDPTEQMAASEHFRVVTQRTELPSGSLVVGRYSVLPFYMELWNDIVNVGSTLINAPSQHNYLADIGNWYRDLKGITPETWGHMECVPDKAWPCVLKGATNSKKFLWKTHMFAARRDDGIGVMLRLQEDGFLCDQQTYIRKYVPLMPASSRTPLVGPPISKEYRFFLYRGKVLASGFYWSSHIDVLDFYPDPSEVPADFIAEVARRVGNNATFYVVDVAQTVEGGWIVVELNDGQMSGLSECKAYELYSNLRSELAREGLDEGENASVAAGEACQPVPQ